MFKIPVPQAQEERIKALLLVQSELRALARLPIWDSTNALTLEEYTKELGQHLAPADASAFALISLSLLRFSDRFQKDIHGIVLALSEGLRDCGWSSGDVAIFSDFFLEISSVFTSQKLKIIEKTSDLYNGAALVLESFRAISEIRPVFDDSRASVVGYILTTRANFRISDGLNRDEEHIVDISTSEIDEMIIGLQLAKQKIEVLKAELQSTGKRVLIFGEQI